MRLSEANTALDAILKTRVGLHRARREGDITATEYKAGLRAVREAEDRLEVVREEHGCEVSRAFELVTGEKTLDRGARAWKAAHPPDRTRASTQRAEGKKLPA